MKQIMLPVTVHLNIRLPLAVIQPEPPTASEPEAHSCRNCHSCGGCGKYQYEEEHS